MLDVPRRYVPFVLAWMLAAGTVACAEPSGVPDGLTGHIAFSSTRDGNAEIYTAELETGTITRLTNDPAIDIQPAWSPDGTRLAFISARGPDTALYVMNADGSGVTRLTNPNAAGEPAVDMNPAWSPDGTRVAFDRQKSPGIDLYTIRPDGTELLHLDPVIPGLPPEFTCFMSRDPTWSADGVFLAFMGSSCAQEAPVIFRVHWTGGVAERLVMPGVPPLALFSPALSPVDSRLVYVWFEPDRPGGNLYTSLSIGGPNDIQARDPAWSPDGAWVVFIALGGELYLMSAQGTNVQSLGIDSRAAYPAWTR